MPGIRALQEWALGEGVPPGVTLFFAVQAAEAADDDCRALWESWRRRNLRDCPSCGDPWLVLLTNGWGCETCGYVCG